MAADGGRSIVRVRRLRRAVRSDAHAIAIVNEADSGASGNIEGQPIMLLTANQSRALLLRFGVYATETCDKCGQVLGPLRYTRQGESGVWCSRSCRGDGERVRTLKPGRPPKYKTDRERRAAKTEQQRRYRHGPSVEKTVCIARETKDLRTQKRPLSDYGTSRPRSGHLVNAGA
jgi:hypothetical protein